MKDLRACRKCHYITESDTCPICGGDTSKDWHGCIIIVDHKKSALAKKMNVSVNGRFALRVR
ncbi:MAG: DNA-directed RNA polymerase subunit E [Thermoplasmata archaeon]|nr:MAG: DNA-directed RNA polymerase subunit E [Thermoplasmata archaeon]